MIACRPFPDYADYVYRQGRKARERRLSLLADLQKHRASFTRTFCTASAYLKHGSVLCLGARTGAESLGAEDAGFWGSVGMDLHPVGPTVVQGDWHDLAFPDASFANVYTNSLDHCLYLDRFAAEVRRVLVPDGRFYLMATNRRKSRHEWMDEEDSNEGLYWSHSDELCRVLTMPDAMGGFGFNLRAAWHDGKWGHYVFAVTE